MIVLDASAVVDYLLQQDARGAWVGEWMLRPGQRLNAPHLIDVESAHALRRAAFVGDVAEERAENAIEALLDLQLQRYPQTILLPRIWELRRSLTAYDAAYVALAETLDAPLLTTDQALARTTGHRARIEAFPG